MRVLIAEDQLLLREGLVNVLTIGGTEVVAALDSAEQILPTVRRLRPELALLDIRLPPTGTDEGLRAAIAIRSEMPDQPVALLSQHVELLYVEELLAGDGGGVGYLLKDRVFDSRRFLTDLQTIASGGTVVDPDVVSALMQRHRHQAQLSTLTRREYEALTLMAQGQSNRSIADHMVITEKAVANLINNIFAKLNLTADDPTTSRRVRAVLTYLRD